MLAGDLPNLDILPKKCYKCNCQKFDRSNDNEEICAVCNDDEGEHHQVRSYYIINSIFY